MKYRAIITKLNGYYTHKDYTDSICENEVILGESVGRYEAKYVGEGSTIEVAIKRARRNAEKGGRALISGEIDVYRLGDYTKNYYYNEWVEGIKYVGTFSV